MLAQPHGSALNALPRSGAVNRVGNSPPVPGQDGRVRTARRRCRGGLSYDSGVVEVLDDHAEDLGHHFAAAAMDSAVGRESCRLLTTRFRGTRDQDRTVCYSAG
jgi:hypothetical protein